MDDDMQDRSNCQTDETHILNRIMDMPTEIGNSLDEVIRSTKRQVEKLDEMNLSMERQVDKLDEMNHIRSRRMDEWYPEDVAKRSEFQRQPQWEIVDEPWEAYLETEQTVSRSLNQSTESEDLCDFPLYQNSII
jgi:asparagine synthetase A